MPYVLCPALGFIPPNSTPEKFTATWEHFTSIPWCRLLLVDDHDFDSPQRAKVIGFIGQGFNPESPQHDQFIGVTLSSPTALSHLLSFFQLDNTNYKADSSTPIVSVSTLFAVGSGVSGYKGILHGGMIMTMLDEGFNAVVEINTLLGKAWTTQSSAWVTATMNVKFLKPVPIDGEVCVTATLDNIEDRRKVKLVARMIGANGETMAIAESLWIAKQAKI